MGEKQAPQEKSSQAAARRGPRPLPFHLNLSSLTWMSSRAALPIWRQGLPAWKPHLTGSPLGARHVALAEAVTSQPLDHLNGVLDREIHRRAEAFGQAVERYRQHPYRRDLPQGEVLWREGGSVLIDYGPFVPAAARADAIPLLVVPSLVNRAYILDLSAETSLLRWLAARGIRPFLVDWGTPGDAEREFGLEDYVVGRLGRALERLTADVGRPVQALGYCMGGLLAMALAVHHPEKLQGLALLATPWDFHADNPTQAALLTAVFPALLPVMGAARELPADVIQTLFTAQDPMLVLRKYLAFGRLDPESDRARRFVALEDWLNDGVPLTVKVAHESFLSWYGENLTGRGEWQLGGRSVVPTALACPSFCVIPSQDRIVPPASAEALAAALPRGAVLRPATGHIGMAASLRAPKSVWGALRAWLQAQG